MEYGRFNGRTEWNIALGHKRTEKSPNQLSKEWNITQKRIMEQIENEKIMENH